MFKKTLVISGLVFSATSLQAADINFEPRVQAGYMDYELTIDPRLDELRTIGEAQDLFPGAVIDVGAAEAVRGGIDRRGAGNNASRDAGGKNSIDDQFFIFGLGGTLSAGSYFADFYYQESVDGEADTFSRNPEDRVETGEPPRVDNGNIPINFNVSDLDIDRTDYSVSLGRGFEFMGNPLSLFIGYRNGQTEITQTRNGDSLGRRNGNGTDGEVTNNRRITEIEMDGPYIGAAYGFSLGSGVLGFNIAIADLDAKYDFNEVARVNGSVVSESNTNFTGDATGVNFGVNWKAPISGNWRYAVALNYYKYDFSLEGETSRTVAEEMNPGTVSTSADLEEEALTALLSVSYSF